MMYTLLKLSNENTDAICTTRSVFFLQEQETTAQETATLVTTALVSVEGMGNIKTERLRGFLRQSCAQIISGWILFQIMKY